MTKDELIKVIPSDMGGNPSLYITKNRNGDIYVNNARIIPSLTVEMTNSLGMRQVRYDLQGNSIKNRDFIYTCIRGIIDVKMK